MGLRINSRQWKQFLSISIGLVLVFSFQNCADQQFKSNEQQVLQTGGGCTDIFNSIASPVELIFVVDVSGSNLRGPNGDPGTDPNKATRAGSINNFFNAYKNKTNFTWSLISFATPDTITHAANADADLMTVAIQSLIATKDSGDTPYATALDRAESMVSDDDGDPNKKYVVVFWSDGRPNPSISDSSLEEKIDRLLAAAPGRVSLNTVYYGPDNSSASSRMERMADMGGGNFLDTYKYGYGAGTVFSISDFVTVPGVACNSSI